MVDTHALTIDVEHWYDATLAARPPRVDPSYAERELDSILALLERHGAHATFFVLGSLAEDLPQCVRRIAAAGHEVACHGLTHELLWQLGPARLRAEAGRARALLQDLSGQEVAGFRAPTWSLDRRTPWAPATLLALGFSYDASVFPLRTPLYGAPGAPTSPYLLAGGGGSILELPPAVLEMGPLRLPVAGGIYWRVLPAGIVSLALRGQSPRVLYAHPWEAAPAGWSLPRSTGLSARFAMRFGRGHLAKVLDRLLATVRLVPIAEAYANLAREDLRTWSLDAAAITDGS